MQINCEDFLLQNRLVERDFRGRFIASYSRTNPKTVPSNNCESSGSVVGKIKGCALFYPKGMPVSKNAVLGFSQK